MIYALKTVVAIALIGLHHFGVFVFIPRRWP
jgi:hypothetical protein